MRLQGEAHTAASAALAATMVESAPSDDVSRSASRMSPVCTPVAVSPAVNMTCCSLPRNCAAPTPVAAVERQPSSVYSESRASAEGCAGLALCQAVPMEHGVWPAGSREQGSALVTTYPW